MSATSIVTERRALARTSTKWPPADLVLTLALVVVLAGCGLMLAMSEIGSGDYGQWLMAARPYLSESIPAYRADAAVPPVVPFAISLAIRLTGDPLVGIHLFAVLLLLATGAAAAAAGWSLWRSRLAMLLVAAATLLFTDRFVELFAFGGLLQAGALVWMWLSVAAFFHAGDGTRREWLWWLAGATATGLGAITHIGTASLSVPAAIVVAVLAALRRPISHRARMLRLAPLAVALAAVALIWLVELLPGGAALVRNPASLSYRGPERLLHDLVAYWPGAVVIAVAGTAMLAGSAVELGRRRGGPWIVVTAWMAVTIAVVGLSVVSGAATDYPRFATPLLAPMMVAFGGAGAWLLGAAARPAVRRTHRGTVAGWAAAPAIGLVLVAIGPAVSSFVVAANGYRLPDQAGLVSAASWLERNLPAGATVLAPAREAKWVEGLTGRATLFSNAVRYSFRADEWERSVAADALLRSRGALANAFFVARFTDDSPTAAPRGLTIAANHGGEYLDLLRVVPSQTRILAPDGGTLASVATLAATDATQQTSPGQLRVTTGWRGERAGTEVAYRQAVSLRENGSVLELRGSVETNGPIGGFELELWPAGGTSVIARSIDGREADLSFSELGSGPPRLRLTLARGGASFAPLANGGLRIEVPSGQLRLLVTDLTAGGSVISGVELLQPADLVDRYDVGAVLLRRDPSLALRQARLEALGFRLADTAGAYAVMVRR